MSKLFGDSGKEKLPFNRKKPLKETASGRSSHLVRGGRQDKDILWESLYSKEALRLLTCFCGLRKETATSHDEELLSLTVKPCPGSTGYTIPLTAMNPAAAQRIYCAIQS
ncbi:thiomorpholine-carboxylate dehydrogenase [Sarotherodon galilaeus]